jgi:serine phosphatase RsbU (regulator of sigma subunit)/HAMP domain-containing protein
MKHIYHRLSGEGVDVMRRRLVSWVSSLSVTHKLVIIYLLDLIVTTSILVSYVDDKRSQIAFRALEKDGTAIIVPVQPLYRELLDQATGAPGASLDTVTRAFTATDQARQRRGRDMMLDGSWTALADAAHAYAAAPADQRQGPLLSRYEDRLDAFIARVGDGSNLILDPDLDTFYAMEIVVVHMPAILRDIVDLSDTARQNTDPQARRGQLLYLDGRLRGIQADIRRSLEAGTGGNPDGLFAPHLAGPGKAFDDRLNALIAAESNGSDTLKERDAALDTGFAFWQDTTRELDRLLVIRIHDLFRQMFMKLGVTLVLALGVLAAVTFIGRQITRPVQELAAVAKTVGSRDPRRAHWESHDEFGALVAAFNDMLDRLAIEGKQREDMAAAAKAAEAQRDLLQAIPLPILVTSLDGTRTLNANEAARALFSEALTGAGLGLGFLRAEMRRRIIEALAATGAVDEVEVECTARDGAVSWMVLSGRAVTYHGEQVALIGLTPVNELKRVQTALSEAKEAAEINAGRLRAITETVLSSIRYASRIQRSIFPNEQAVQRFGHGLDIWVEQRDVVGGDWHWVERFDDGDLVFLCDCTGHGVPGALITMLVSACLRRVIDDHTHDQPAEILRSLHRLVRETLLHGVGESAADDGLDAVCMFLERHQDVARIASARVPLLHATAEGLTEIKGDRTSLGYPTLPEEIDLTEHRIPVRDGDLFYLFTDGVTDQIGGEGRRMFGRHRLRKLVDEMRTLPVSEQVTRLRDTLTEYRRQEAVRDDASLLILRVRGSASTAQAEMEAEAAVQDA